MTKAFWFRRLAQIFVIFLFILLPWLNSKNFHAIQGSLFSFDLAGMPFADPASAAQAALSGTLSWEPHLAIYLLGALISLFIAFFIGRIFCGWICPYGFFSEILHNLRSRKNAPMLPAMQKSVWLVKSVFVALILAISAIFTLPLITFISMPGQMSLLPMTFFFNVGANALLALSLLPLCALFAECVTGKRLWCEYLCPQSVFLGMAAWRVPNFLPALRIGWQAKRCDCGKSAACANACTLNINPRQKNGPPRNVCSMCGDCVKACRSHGGALSFNCRSFPD